MPIDRKSGAQVLARIADAEQRAFSAERKARDAEKILVKVEETITEKRLELQDIENQITTGKEELRLIAEKKQKLLALIDQLQQECANAQEVLDTAIGRQSKYLQASATEIKNQNQKLETVKRHLEKINNLISESEPVAKELMVFIEKNKDARTRFLAQQGKLTDAEKQYKAIKEELEIKFSTLQFKEKDLDGLKTYLQDLYGRMASYVAVIKETVEYANRYMEETGVPMHFAIPDGQLLEIDMFNFDKKYEQT